MNSVIVTILLICGLVFYIGGTVGIIRFPDFYTRLHAAGKLDTMGLLLIMVATIIYLLHDFTVENIFTGLKILLIVVFVYITSPTATHAIADAGIRAGLIPWTKKETKERP